MPVWDAGVAGGSLTCCASMPSAVQLRFPFESEVFHTVTSPLCRALVSDPKCTLSLKSGVSSGTLDVTCASLRQNRVEMPCTRLSQSMLRGKQQENACTCSVHTLFSFQIFLVLQLVECGGQLHSPRTQAMCMFLGFGDALRLLLFRVVGQVLAL